MSGSSGMKGLLAIATLLMASAQAQTYKADVPASVTTPASVDTRIGTLKFTDGLPDDDTVRRVYDNLDFSRGVEAFLVGMPAASVYALCEGLAEAGVQRNRTIGIGQGLVDAKSLFLTPNSTTVYGAACFDLTNGPVVLEVPPKVLGPINDAYFRYVADVGLVGPDKGQGGKYLLVPPGYQGTLPTEGYFIARTRTNYNLVFFRAFVEKGDIAAAARNIRSGARVYPFSAAGNPPSPSFVDFSGKQFNTVHANDFHFYDELDAVVQAEPANAFEPETVGLFAAIGIKKGKPFAPDARMKALLTEAVAVGNATARAILFASRDPRAQIFPDRQWFTVFIGGSSEFADGAERMLDARTMFHYYATGITPAMAAAKPGSGSAYAVAARDSKGRFFDGAKTYRITMPAPVPVGQFWAFTVYDNQTRSLLETDQKLAGLDSNQPGVKKNADGSVTVYFAPKAPSGQQGNWVQTMPGKSWNTILRLYAPLQPWFDKTWKPGDFERVD